MPVGELQARWTSREFAELLAFEASEPDDAARFEQACAVLAAVLARALGAEVEAAALVPDYWGARAAPARRRQSPGEIAAVAQLFAGIYNQSAAATAQRGKA